METPNKLVLLERFPITKTRRHPCKYLCLCGVEFMADYYDVNRGDGNGTKSCGCHRRNNMIIKNLTHGESATKLYSVYISIKKRCNNKNHHAFKDYGGRGISLSMVWNNYEVFRDWALANGYEEGLSLDRIENDGNYEPSNCRWVTQKIQVINKRIRKSAKGLPSGVRSRGKTFSAEICVNYILKYLGTFKTIQEASEAYQKARKERDEMYYKEFNNKQTKKTNKT